MNILKRFFNRSPSAIRFQMIEDRGNGFYSWDGKLYKSDIVRACIRPKIKAIGKLIPEHIRNNKQENCRYIPARNWESAFIAFNDYIDDFNKKYEYRKISNVKILDFYDIGTIER